MTLTTEEIAWLNWQLRGRLPMWVVYDHPADYPDCFVARLWVSLHEPEATRHAITAPTLDALRALLPEGLTRLGRAFGDDPVIVETWLA